MEKKQYSAPRVTIFTAQLTSGLLAGSDPTLSGGLDKPGTDGGEETPSEAAEKTAEE